MRRHWTPGGGIRLRWALKRLTNRLGCWRFGHGPTVSTLYTDDRLVREAAQAAVIYGMALYRPTVIKETCTHCGATVSRRHT